MEKSDLSAQPNRRELSRRYDRERKKLRAAIRREQKALENPDLTNVDRVRKNKTIKNMQKQIEDSYFDRKKGEYQIKINSFERDVESFVYRQRGLGVNDEKSTQEERERKNQFFIDQMNASTRKGGYSTLSGEETHLFFQTTMNAWRGDKGTDGKISAILQTTGYNQIGNVYDLLMHPEKYNTEEGRAKIEDLLKSLSLGNTTYLEYVENLKFVRNRFPQPEDEEKLQTTEKLPNDSPERTGSPDDYMKIWGSYLSAISGA